MADVRRIVRDWWPDDGNVELACRLIEEPITEDKLAGILALADRSGSFRRAPAGCCASSAERALTTWTHGSSVTATSSRRTRDSPSSLVPGVDRAGALEPRVSLRQCLKRKASTTKTPARASRC